MFEQFLGVPAHPLIVHAAVVFIPLQIAAAIVYAFLPSQRARITWAMLSLAVIAPAAGWAARLSGNAFQARLVRNGFNNKEILGKIATHQSYGNVTSYLTLALSVLMVGLWLLIRSAGRAGADAGRAKMLSLVFGIAMVVLGAVTGYYVFRTGDLGAHIVWQGL